MNANSAIDIRKETSHIPADDLSKRINTMVAKLTQELSLTTRWDAASQSVCFEAKTGLAKGTDGHLQIGPGWINIVVRLPMMLRIQTGIVKAVEEQINKTLDEALA